MRAPGDKAALHKRETPVGCDRFILRHGGLRPGAGRIVDIDLVILRVLEEIPLEPVALPGQQSRQGKRIATVVPRSGKNGERRVRLPTLGNGTGQCA